MTIERSRQRAAATLAAAVLIFGVAACGTESADPRANPQVSPTESTKPPAKLNGPIVFRQTGGVAGVDIRLTVDLNGKATLTSRGLKPFSCSVEPTTMDSIKSEAQMILSDQVPTGKKTKPSRTVYDAFNYFLTVNGEEYRITGGEKIPKQIQPLLAAMSEVVKSAEALRDGKAEAKGPQACTA